MVRTVKKKIYIPRKTYTRLGRRITREPYYKEVLTTHPEGVPESKKFFHPDFVTGWKKTDSKEIRRDRVLEAANGDLLKAARFMNALANVTKDRETKRLAREDAKYLFDEYDRMRLRTETRGFVQKRLRRAIAERRS